MKYKIFTLLANILATSSCIYLHFLSLSFLFRRKPINPWITSKDALIIGILISSPSKREAIQLLWKIFFLSTVLLLAEHFSEHFRVFFQRHISDASIPPRSIVSRNAYLEKTFPQDRKAQPQKSTTLRTALQLRESFVLNIPQASSLSFQEGTQNSRLQKVLWRQRSARNILEAL